MPIWLAMPFPSRRPFLPHPPLPRPDLPPRSTTMPTASLPSSTNALPSPTTAPPLSQPILHRYPCATMSFCGPSAAHLPLCPSATARLYGPVVVAGPSPLHTSLIQPSLRQTADAALLPPHAFAPFYSGLAITAANRGHCTPRGHTSADAQHSATTWACHCSCTTAHKHSYKNRLIALGIHDLTRLGGKLGEN